MFTAYYPTVESLMPMAFQVCFKTLHFPKMREVGIINVYNLCHGYTPVKVLMPSTLTQCELANVRSKRAATSLASVSDCLASSNLTSKAKLLAYRSVSSMSEKIEEACLS